MHHTYTVEVPDVRYFERQVLCREGCPVRTDSGAYVQAIAEGRYEEAYHIARAPNPFASICGRICAAPCEAKCRRSALDAPVSIRALKRFVCERYGVESDAFDLSRIARQKVPVREGPGTGHRVAVIGAGPAGLACAHDLALWGFEVTVFEAEDVAGGMLVLGIPEYRLPREVVRAEIAAISALGVEIRLNQRLGASFSLADLKEQGYEAIFVGIGAHKSRELSIEGVHLDGVLRAIDYLLNINRGYRVTCGNRVVVIGGGNVAFDVARSLVRKTTDTEGMSPEELQLALKEASAALDALTTSLTEASPDIRLALDVARAAARRGVPEVHLYCLESREEIPADIEEIEEARLEGIQIHHGWGPARILGDGTSVTGIELVQCLRVFDEAGKFHPVFEEGSEVHVACDTVILAIGQAAELSWICPEDNLAVSPRGALQTDRTTLATSRDDVFAGGDVAFGPRIVIDAVAEGKRAARSIARFLIDQAPTPPLRTKITTYSRHHMPAGYETTLRRLPPMLSVERRIGLSEVEQIYPEPLAVTQAHRCLKCHVSPVFDGDKCILCGGCADICPEFCLRLVDVTDLAGGGQLTAALIARYGEPPSRQRHAAIIKDETRCIRCGLCAERCPTGAITMERVESKPA